MAAKSIEYHGWIVLATSSSSWDDGDFEQAFDQVRQLLAGLPEEEGHSALFPDDSVLPWTVYLKGYDVESVDVPVGIMTSIAKILDGSYGELTTGDADGAWRCDSAHIRRYVLSNGRVTLSRRNEQEV